MSIFKSLFISLIFCFSALAETINLEGTQIYYRTFNPKSEVKADFLYLHGFADSLENHLPLFDELLSNGIRVISFDFPGHGKSKGNINFTSFEELASIAASIEIITRTSSKTPLFIGGWSTGGLLAVRIAQAAFRSRFSRKISSLVLYAPGVDVKKCVGNAICKVTNQTLTHNSLLWNRDIKPSSPFHAPLFAAQLLAQSGKAYFNLTGIEGMSALVFVAGENDKYIHSSNVRTWASSLRNDIVSSMIMGIECKFAKHELDNEPDIYGGRLVRKMTAKYILYKLGEVQNLNDPRPCSFF